MSTLDELISTVQQLAPNITGVADPDARHCALQGASFSVSD